MRSLSIAVTVTAASALFTPAEPAAAQNALGDGTSLDRSLWIGAGGRNNRVRDLSAQLRANNAIVTGNAPGGRSFRGDVGYLAPDDFRAGLGANDLFDFRRDSVYSALEASTGVRYTDALQYQFAVTTGQAPPPVLAGSALGVSRFGAGASGGALASPLRSTSDFRATRALSPTLLGYAQTNNGEMDIAYAASPLLGVRVLPLEPMLITDPSAPRADDASEDDLDGPIVIPSVSEQQEAKAEEAARRLLAIPLSGFETGADGVKSSFDLGLRQDFRVNTRLSTETINRRFEDAGVPDPFGAEQSEDDEAEPLAVTLDTLRERLAQRNPRIAEALERARAAASAPEATDPDAPAQPRPITEQWRDLIPEEDLPRDDQDPMDQTDPTGLLGAAEEDDLAVTPSIATALRAAGATRIDSFIPGADTDPTLSLLYRRHMAAAEALLKDERYFDAEDRFTRALASRPGDPLASVGRVHSEIGAGLFLSAGQNLRRFIATRPDLVGLRYGDKLLPTPERLETILAALATRSTDESMRVRQESALISAYLGYQLDREPLIRDGLDAFERSLAIEQDADRTLALLLRQVWLAPPPPEQAPAEQEGGTTGDASSTDDG